MKEYPFLLKNADEQLCNDSTLGIMVGTLHAMADSTRSLRLTFVRTRMKGTGRRISLCLSDSRFPLARHESRVVFSRPHVVPHAGSQTTHMVVVSYRQVTVLCSTHRSTVQYNVSEYSVRMLTISVYAHGLFVVIMFGCAMGSCSLPLAEALMPARIAHARTTASGAHNCTVRRATCSTETLRTRSGPRRTRRR